MKISLMILFLFIAYPGEKVTILTEEGGIIKGEILEPQEAGITPDIFEIFLRREGEIAISKAMGIEEKFEEGALPVLLEGEGDFISAVEIPWEEVDEKVIIQGEEEWEGAEFLEF